MGDALRKSRKSEATEFAAAIREQITPDLFRLGFLKYLKRLVSRFSVVQFMKHQQSTFNRAQFGNETGQIHPVPTGLYPLSKQPRSSNFFLANLLRLSELRLLSWFVDDSAAPRCKLLLFSGETHTVVVISSGGRKRGVTYDTSHHYQHPKSLIFLMMKIVVGAEVNTLMCPCSSSELVQ